MPSEDATDPSAQNGGQSSSPPGLEKSNEKSSKASFAGSKGSQTQMAGSMSTASMRRRRYERRQSSVFDFPHLDSVVSVPSIQLEELDLDAVPWWTSHRFRLALLCFVGFVCLYAQRVNLSIAIVSMVDHSDPIPKFPSNASDSNVTFVSSLNLTGYTLQNLSGTPNVTQMPPKKGKCPDLSSSGHKGEFRWSKELEGLILGAFFWGYLILQVPGGRLSEKFGAKKVIGVCMFPVAVLNILTPVAARASPYLLIVVRIFVGLGESVMYPAAQALWSKWSPPNERSRLIGFSYAGGQFGNAIIFPIGGYLCAYGFDGGWPSVFYVIGAASFIWCIFWVLFAHDTPDDDKNITLLEKKYIKYSLGDSKKKKINKDIPWKSIFTSGPVYAIIIAHTCGNYGAYMLLTKIPAYMKEVLKFDIKANGLYSMLPYLTFWFFITLSGMLADQLISRKIFTIGRTRKLMAAIGMIGPSAFLIGTGFMECDQAVGAVVMLTISVGLCGFHFSGYFINHGDIAPPYAGTLFGISNTMATIPGILSPYIVSAMTRDGTRQQWQNTFYKAAAIYCFGLLCYVILGDGEVQKWAGGGDDEELGDGSVGFGLDEIREAKEEDEEEDEDEDGEKDKGKNLLPSVTTKPDDGNGSLKEKV